MISTRSVLHMIALLVIASAYSLAQGTYTQFDDPSGVGRTYAIGVNSGGDIAGYYIDAGNVAHGYILSNGVYTTVDYPGAAGTVLFGINDVGQVVGYTDPLPYVGFVYSITSGTFTKISYPGSSYTFPQGINNSGTIVGVFGDPVANESFGFELVNSSYRTIAPKNAKNSTAWGISSSGVVAGSFNDLAGTSHNYLLKGGVYTIITIPPSGEGGFLTLVSGINASGTALVGNHQKTNQYQIGFLDQHRVLQQLTFPDAYTTTAFGVNDSGEVVGYFTNLGGDTHGYTWTP